MFKWLNLKEFMNTYQEWHAFTEGVSESFCFWKPRQKISDELREELESEHHYYTFGRVVGFIGLVLFGIAMLVLIKVGLVGK